MENNWRIGEVTHIVMKQGDIRTLAVGFTNLCANTIHAVKLSIGATDSFNDPILFGGEHRLIVKKADLNLRENERTTVTVPLGNYDIKNVDIKIEQIVYSTGEIIDTTYDSPDFPDAGSNNDGIEMNNEEECKAGDDKYSYGQEVGEDAAYHRSCSEFYAKKERLHVRSFRTQSRETSGVLKLGVLVLLIVFYPLGLVLMWEKKVFSTPVRISLTTLFAIFFVGRLISVNQRRQHYRADITSAVVEESEKEASAEQENVMATDFAEDSEISGSISTTATTVEISRNAQSYAEDGTEYAILYDGRSDDGSGRIDVFADVLRDDPEMKAHVKSVLNIFYDECAASRQDTSSEVIVYVYNTKDNYKSNGVVQGQYCVAYWTTEKKDAITWMPEGAGVGVDVDTEAWTY